MRLRALGYCALLIAFVTGSVCLTARAAEESQPLSEPLTTWTMRLASAVLAQYPPGHGTPQTY